MKPEQLAFWAAPAIAPTWPAPHTLPARALACMLTGQALTQPEFLRIARSWRLAAAVHTLARLGWPIEADSRPAPTDVAPARHIASYRIAPRHLPALRAQACGRG